MTEHTAAKIVQLLCLFDIIESVKRSLLVKNINENWKLLKFLIGNIGELQYLIYNFFPS